MPANSLANTEVGNNVGPCLYCNILCTYYLGYPSVALSGWGSKCMSLFLCPKSSSENMGSSGWDLYDPVTHMLLSMLAGDLMYFISNKISLIHKKSHQNLCAYFQVGTHNRSGKTKVAYGSNWRHFSQSRYSFLYVRIVYFYSSTGWCNCNQYASHFLP